MQEEPRKPAGSRVKLSDPQILAALIGLFGTLVVALIGLLDRPPAAPAVTPTPGEAAAALVLATESPVPLVSEPALTPVETDYSTWIHLSRLSPDCPTIFVLPAFIQPEHGSRVVMDQIYNEDYYNWPVAHDGSGSVTLSVLVTSQVPGSEWIELGNTLTVDIQASSELPDPLHAAETGACGGAGEVRQFSTVELDSSFDALQASTTYSAADFFTLQPGEFEVFKITFHCRRPGRYRLQVSIPYRVPEQRGTLTTPQQTEVICPASATLWDAVSSEGIEYVGEYVWEGE